METRAATRIGGHVVAESLRALGAEVVFGLPGVHALPIWEGLRSTDLRVLGFRQELNAGFAADGYARVTGRPTPLVVSTGPGAFMTLAPLMEAFTAFVPVVVVATQIDSKAIGAGHGHLHETPNQTASFAPLVKWTARADSTADIPQVLAEAWRRAGTPPQGPVYVEVPVDVLHATPAGSEAQLDGSPGPGPVPSAAELERAAVLLRQAARPLLVAGGGSVRSGATSALLELAARLDAPVATTYTGKGVFPEEHPLAVGSAWDDAAHRGLVADADVILCVGSWLGYELSDAFPPTFGGALIQVDAVAERIGINVPAAVGLVGDARATLESLLDRIDSSGFRDGAARAAAVREIVGGRAAQSSRLELDLLETIEDVLPEGGAAAWDSTILAYTACWYLRAAEPRRFLYPAGSSTLGYGFPAALGAAAALSGAPVLAVVGDGGFQYGLAELATARQHGLDVVLLVIDDGGYGILRQYQDDAGFAHFGVELEHPDFVALSAAYDVPARRSSAESVRGDLEWALAEAGPAVVVLEETLVMPEPGRM